MGMMIHRHSAEEVKTAKAVETPKVVNDKKVKKPNK